MLAWGDQGCEKEDAALYACGQDLIRALFEKCKETAPPIRKVEVQQQFNNIDVLCLIDDDHAILIEDKVGTSEHSDQLERYKKVVQEHYGGRTVLPIYLKTEEQSDLEDVVDAGYTVFSREDFLEVLCGYSGPNQILKDYRAHLLSVSEQVNAYKTKPIRKWDGWFAWQGFFQYFQNIPDKLDGDWEYVPNASGGFMAFYWSFIPVDNCELYLQLEGEKLCIKIEVTEDVDKSEIRNLWSERTLGEAERGRYKSLVLKRPDRFGHGRTMTIAQADDYRMKIPDSETIDLASTVANLELAEELLTQLANSHKEGTGD